MDINSLKDFADTVNIEIGKYMINPIILSPKELMAEEYQVEDLKWDSINYGEEEIEKIPNNKRGIYAFAICNNNDVLPPHSYILYIGIAGRDSNRSLRERYRDYLNEKKVMKRSKIARMIGTWHDVLRFLFAPIDDDVSSEDLKKLELQLSSAMMPPFSEGDLSAELKHKRRALR